MRIFNINGNEPLIIHANGPAKNTEAFYYMIENNMPIYKPDDLTIIVCESDFDNQLKSEFTHKHQTLLYQLVRNDIQFINAYTYNLFENQPFVWMHKIDYYFEALKYVNTKYALLLDARDVKIRTLDGIIDRFLTYNTKILFGAEKVNYDINFYMIEQTNDQQGSSMKYANSGCIIGYTDALLSFFGHVSNTRKENNILSYPGTALYINNDQYKIDLLEYSIISGDKGDQAYIRSFFNMYDQQFINVDYKSLLFMNCGGANIYIN